MKNRSFLEILKTFLSPLKDNKNLLYFAIAYFWLDALVNNWLLYLFKVIVDEIENWLSFYFYVFLFFIVLKFLVIFFFRNFSWTFYPKMRDYFYTKYLSEFVELDNNKTEIHGTWKVISIIEKSVWVWVEQLNIFFRDFFSWFLNVILSLFIVFTINFYYWLIVFILIILIFIITIFVQKANKIYRLNRRESNIEITKNIVNVIISKFEILQNHKIKNETKKISDLLKLNMKMNRQMSNNYLFIDLFSVFVIYISRAFIILLFVYWYNKWIITMWDFVALVSFSYILEKSLVWLADIYLVFTNNLVDIEKIWDFFEDSKKIEWYETWKDFKYKKWDIEIKNITFSYYPWKNIFENFSLNIEGWKITSFVWNSWSWKTTLVKLIAWYIKQNSGKIFVDWQDLTEVSLKSYYKNIWYLTQEPSVFDGTILENLTYAVDRELEKWELEKVIKDANSEFIYDLPNWLETQIWERWVKLSWWQKQRLAIAKIMLKNPSIIILDEPTSALDSFSEEAIRISFEKLFAWKTVFIIAHRLQTVKEADDIIVFENGKIVERWIHSSLIKHKWYYKKMLDLQSGF